ncbi:MAG: hypothetical protein U9R79_13840 [Armatimonadota bacterium]|nr:hypothetical protein [Armatimonadota bacterium]
MRTNTCICLALMAAAPVAAQEEDMLLTNGGFESVREVELDEAGRYAGWQLGDPPLAPEGWQLNSHYVGSLEVRSDGPHSGQRYIRITAPEDLPTHIYQIRDDLQQDQWYRISARIRGGPAILYVYEYFHDRPMRVPGIAQTAAPADQWREAFGYYLPGGEGFRNAGPAIAIPEGQTTDIDSVRMEPVEPPREAPAGEEVAMETDTIRLALSADGRLTGLEDLQTGEDYAAPDAPLPVFAAERSGMSVPARSVTRDGDVLTVQFVDPDVTARVRAVARSRHVLFELLDIAPDDVSMFTIELPVRRLETVAGAFNATYDDEFGICLFGTTITTYNSSVPRGGGGQSLRCHCTAAHGMEGSGFALVAAPREHFDEAIMEAERATGLPCPMLDGQWARRSEMAHESYLFATRVTQADIDTLIDYAKLGGFGTVIILKNDWLANHGHYDINTESFPGGLEGLKRAVRRIHDAGLHAGVHVFGPSISPDDPWVTPVPHDDLASVPCPPLAEAVGAEDTTLTLTAQPEMLPPATPRSRAFPGYTIRIGDELVQYTEVEVGPPFRFLGCTRGALGSRAAAHPAGAEVRGLLRQWGFFLVEPDSELAEQLTRNFGRIVNQCDLDMVYFDASDGTLPPYLDRWYYLNRMHLGYYKQFDHDVLYQTSTGTGSNILWHIVPRSASADGHGDIKGYLDQRWPGILRQRDNFTRSDIGWYYMFSDVRPDQIEYVRAKALGIDGSISIEASRESLEGLPLARKTFEMLARYERARLAGYPPEEVRQRLLQPGQDFKLFETDEGFRLYRAAYEQPRKVDGLDGEVNVWRITNDLQVPCELGVEIVPGSRPVAFGAYEAPEAVTIESFDDADTYVLGGDNQYEQYVIGPRKEISDTGPVMAGVSQRFELSEDAKVGASALRYTATNEAPTRGWSGIGRCFTPPLDLTEHAGIGLWVNGDSGYETLRIQLRDTQGAHAEDLLTIDFAGWSLHTFPLPDEDFDRSQVEYLLFYFNGIPRGASVGVILDEVRALPEIATETTLQAPSLVVNGQQTVFPVRLEPGEALTCDGPDGATFWPVGMEPGRALDVPLEALHLQPGENTVVLEAEQFPGDVSVLLYRMWPLEE